MGDPVAPSVIGPGARLAGRFRIHSQLGAGAFGAVYAAEDASGRVVAVKRLTRVTGATIYRFKREFRALADRAHPNLVRLYELFSEGGEWFFSMELVEGEHFDRYVLGPRGAARQEDTAPDAPPASSGDAPLAPPRAPNLARLRATLPQLVAAIRALHDAGIVHRDLKPANVLVTREGRVVVLDFGLATERDPDAQRSTLGVVMGTPTYMAPEQALGRATTEAADWYALGVMLFEALYGRTPFTGTVHDVMTAKLSPSTWQWPEPPPAARDLDELCRALLRPEPAERPSGDEIARRTAAAPSDAPSGEASRAPAFVGRERELRALDDALAAVGSSRTVVVRVRGPSGVGKSALMRRFLEALPPDVVALQGRCYERESVPYKTLDGVVDALTRYLGRLSVEEASLLVPREAGALCRLFPVFARLPLLADQPDRLRSASPHEERRRGFAALREMLARIGDRRRLVVTIDDMQWGDGDSIEPLAALLGGVDPPRLLLLLAYRAEDVARSPALRALEEPLFKGAAQDVRDLEVGPLARHDAIALAESLLPAGQRERAEELARESGGIPFLVPELVRAQRKTRGAPVVSLDEALRHRLAELTPSARRLIEVLAVAGQPLAHTVAVSAAGLDDDEGQRAADELVREHLVKVSASDGARSLETFHDRLREAVVGALSDDERRAAHGVVATALARSGAADPEAIAEHYRLAGRLAEARPAALDAAERATHAYAFERAVTLYRVAQEGAPSGERRLLTAKLADVLAYAGRGREAAAAYIDAVHGASPAERRELRRRACEQLLRSGVYEYGTALGRELLRELGEPYPERRVALVASLLTQQALLRARGLSFVERAADEIDESDASRVDVLYTLATCLAPIDVVRGAWFQVRQLRRALALGDAYRISRGLGVVAISMAIEGGRGLERGEQVAMRATEIALRIDHPYAIGTSLSALSTVSWCSAQWRRSLDYTRKHGVVFRERCPEAAWEMLICDIMLQVRSLFFLGELEEMAEEAERCTRVALERRDDLVYSMSQAIGMTWTHLMRGEPALARAGNDDGVGRWSHREWNLVHQEDFRARVLCDLYEGNAAAALERASRAWEQVRGSLLLHAETERVQTFSLLGSAAVLAGDRREAERCRKALAKLKHRWAEACAASLRAGLLALDGSTEATVAYEQAAVLFEALEMPLYAAVARRRRGEGLGGEQGEALVRACDAALRARGVADPPSFARTLVV